MNYLVILILVMHLGSCQQPTVQQRLQGEWAYMNNDTTYAELLITKKVIYPYHYQENNDFEARYRLLQDTLFILGNDGYQESSKIYFMGADSFKIPGISSATFKKVKRQIKNPQKLATFHYKKNKLLDDYQHNIIELLEQQSFDQMHAFKKAFELHFEHRRDIALYRRQKARADLVLKASN